MLVMHCAQVGITEDINHEVFCSLLKSKNSCALHLQVALSYFLCKLTYKMLEEGFPDEEICCFLELMNLPLSHLSWVIAVRLLHAPNLSRGLCVACG
jgi:hypothetical protein